MHSSLRTFLDLLTRENEIVTIEAEVDPYLEAAEIHRRVIERGGPALLFKRVKGSRYPVVTNLFGTQRRIELAFGPKAGSTRARVGPRCRICYCHRGRPSCGNIVRWAVSCCDWEPETLLGAPVTQVLDQPAQLDELPVLTTWDEDGGPFITLAAGLHRKSN